MIRKSYIFTGNKSTCTGCGACSQICKHDALTMEADEEGFLYPKLNSYKCIQCGLCDATCPVVSTNTENEGNNQHCYVATTSDKFYYMESASIGICTMLSHYVIDNGGVVFGVHLDETTWYANHIQVEDKKGLELIRNSKYLQSSTNDTFSQVKQLLKADRIVLYIGTPCQIAGLKAYLKKIYSNLFTIDLICYGVFSPKLMPFEVKYWENKYNGKISNFRFRSKRFYKNVNGGMVNFDVQVNGKQHHIERYAASSPSYRCYAYAEDGKIYNHRLSCYNCSFRSENRYADLTVGDPWYINNDVISTPSLQCGNVIRSLFSTNTKKGEKLYAVIKDKLILEELSHEKSFCQPALLSAKKDIPKEREELYSLVGKEDYGSLVERLLKCNLDKAQLKFDYNYRIQSFKRLVKKIVLWKQKNIIHI